MLKRARRTWTIPASNVEDLVHDCSVSSEVLRLRTWHRQRDGINRPGGGVAGGNVLGDDLSPRLAGMLLRPMGHIKVPWNGNAMRDGAVHYISTCFDGSPAPEEFRVLELDAIAATCPPAVREAAQYPHWDHKQYVYVFDFFTHLEEAAGVGIAPAVKVITNGDGTGGFTGSDVIVEARVGPLGFVGTFDHLTPENDVTYRDIRERLPNGLPNPDFGRFSTPRPQPADWKFG